MNLPEVGQQYQFRPFFTLILKKPSYEADVTPVAGRTLFAPVVISSTELFLLLCCIVFKADNVLNFFDSMINGEIDEKLPVGLSISSDDSLSEDNDFLDLHTIPDQQVENKDLSFSNIQEKLVELLVSPWKWFRLLIDTFGLYFIFSLFFIQHVIKGFAFGGGQAGWVGMPIYYLYRELRIPASRMQQLRAVASTPWAIKPILGIATFKSYINVLFIFIGYLSFRDDFRSFPNIWLL